MTKKTKSRCALNVQVTADQLGAWKAKASRSGLSLREWVTYSLNQASVLTVRITPTRRDDHE